MKASEKLPRGSFFFIRLGSQMYAGDEVEKRTVEVNDYVEPYSRSLRYDPSKPKWSWPYWQSSIIRRRDNRLEIKPKKIVDELTGRLIPRFTDDKALVKKFRRKKQAEQACERLARLYADIAKPVIELHDGEEDGLGRARGSSSQNGRARRSTKP